MKKLLFAVLLGLAVCGCDAAPRQPPSHHGYYGVPHGATDVRPLGDDWWLFTLEDQGKKHRFLYRNRHDLSVLQKVE